MILASATELIWPFKHSAGTTGLTDAAFSKVVQCNDRAKGTPVTVVEIGGGYYAWKVTPDEEGIWLFDVWETTAPTVRYGTVQQVDDFETRICGEGFITEKDSLFNIKRLLQLIQNAGQGISWRGFRSNSSNG